MRSAQDFLLPLAHQAGLRWWRDWSNQWDAVQPKRDAAFDFRRPDVHINRVLDRKGRMVVLLPYPERGLGRGRAAEDAGISPAPCQGPADRGRARRPSWPPSRHAWRISPQYVRATVKHYQGRVIALRDPQRAALHPLRPAQHCDGYGYKMADYLDILRTAYQAAKAADPKCTVIGGIACGPDSEWDNQFIAQGGLQWCDVTNYHLYPSGSGPRRWKAPSRCAGNRCRSAARPSRSG